MKNQRGITIITLVVTIIVLIILAGVSINMLLGENGIITKAKKAAKLQDVASLKEEIRIKILEKELEGQVTPVEIETILSNYGTVNKNEDGTIKSLTPTGKDYEIAYEDIYRGTITKEENNGENAGDSTNNDSDLDTITREEYNAIIERLDALDNGSKSSVSIADVEANISTMQDNVNSSISDINSNLIAIKYYDFTGTASSTGVVSIPNFLKDKNIISAISLGSLYGETCMYNKTFGLRMVVPNPSGGSYMCLTTGTFSIRAFYYE